MKKILFITLVLLNSCKLLQANLELAINNWENALTESSYEKGDVFLTNSHKTNNEIIDVYHQVANACQYLQTQEQPWNIPIPSLATIAEFLLNKAAETECTEPAFKERAIKNMRDLLQETKNENKITYLWFLKYSFFCTLLSNKKINVIDKTLSNDNVLTYTNFMILVFTNLGHKEEDFKTFFNNLDEYSAPKHLNKEIQKNIQLIRKLIGTFKTLASLFPKIVILPYPYDLSARDIFMNLPDQTSHLWLAGFALNKVKFDGYTGSPPHFFLHDLFHLVSLQLLLQSKNHITPDPSQNLILENINYALNEHNKFRKKYIYFLETAKKCLKKLEEKENLSEDTKKIYTFLFFYLFHETNTSQKKLLQMIYTHGSILLMSFKKNPNFFFDEKYYGELLPPDLAINLKNGDFDQFEQYIYSFFDNYYEVIIKDNIIPCIYNSDINTIVITTEYLIYTPKEKYIFLQSNKVENWDNLLTYPSLFETGIHQYAHDIYYEQNPNYTHPVVKDIYTQFYKSFKKNNYVLFYFYDGNPFDWDKDIEKTAFIEIKPHKNTLSDFTLIKPHWYNHPKYGDQPTIIYNPIIGYMPSIEAFVKSVCNTTYEM